MTSSRNYFASLTLLLLMTWSLSLSAARTRMFVDDDFQEFIEGKRVNLNLSIQRGLGVGPELTKVANLDASVIWAAVAAPDGDLFLSTGNEGAVFCMTPQGETTLVFNPQEILTRALALDDSGRLYVGVSPGGKIYRLNTDNQPELLFASGQDYIWDLLFDDQGNLFVATGNAAKVYRLPAGFTFGDEPELWFASMEPHITDLAWDSSGQLLAGSGGNGILYRIESPTQAVALFYSGENEIRKIINGPDDSVLFATYSSTSGISSDSSSANIDDRTNEGGAVTINFSDVSDQGGSTEKGIGKILLLDKSGFVEPLWGNPKRGVFALHLDTDGSLLAGTNTDGELYAIRSITDWELLQQTASGGEISTILPTSGPDAAPGSLWIITSNPAAVYLLSDGPSRPGLFTSRVFDAGQIARWGNMRIAGSPVDLPGIQLRTRSGNTDNPDSSWSPWAWILPTDFDFPIESPPARYLQYQIAFNPFGAISETPGKPGKDTPTAVSSPAGDTANDDSLAPVLAQDDQPEAAPESAVAPTQSTQPTSEEPAAKQADNATAATITASAPVANIQQVQLYYRLKNLSPVIVAIQVLRTGVEVQHLRREISSIDLSKLQSGGSLDNINQEPVSRTKLNLLQETGYITIVWKAIDPNGDDLRYTVKIRKELPISGSGSEEPWHTLEADLEDPIISINTNGFEEGYYRVLVEATDRISNTSNEARTGTQLSAPFIIDNSPPTIESTITRSNEKGDGDTETISVAFLASDELSFLKQASWKLNGKPEKACFPDDGINDSRVESFTLQFDDLEPGHHSILFSVVDEAGRGAVKTVGFDIE